MSLDSFRCIDQLVGEIKKCEEADAMISAVAMAYVCMDTMAFLAMDSASEMPASEDFVAWVNTYLKGDPTQPYQYEGLDVLAGRRCILQGLGSAGLGPNKPTIRMFAYHEGAHHIFRPEEMACLVIIGVTAFLHDVRKGVANFLVACRSDGELQKRVEARLPKVRNIVPLPWSS